jgi:hypothetical protein
MDPGATTALLIGSWKCEKHRKVRGHNGKRAPGSTKVGKKAGIKKDFTKNGRKVPEAEWVEGDLRNMRSFFLGRNIDVEKYDYRERITRGRSRGRPARGRRDVLKRIRQFFNQPGKTRFILYFSGHAYEDGSWSFSLLTRKNVRGGRSASSEGAIGGATGSGSVADSASIGSIREREEESSDEESGNESAREQSDSDSDSGERPEAEDEWNDLVTYEDVIRLWEESREGGGQRFLMLILDCCFSGQCGC